MRVRLWRHSWPDMMSPPESKRPPNLRDGLCLPRIGSTVSKAFAQDTIRDAEGGITETHVAEDTGPHCQPVVQPVAQLVCHYVTTGRPTPDFTNHEIMAEHDLSDHDDYYAPRAGYVVSLKAESFLKGISAIVRAICQAGRGSTSNSSLMFPNAAEATLPRSQRLGLGRGGFTLAVLAV
jgi:hypothetical protein